MQPARRAKRFLERIESLPSIEIGLICGCFRAITSCHSFTIGAMDPTEISPTHLIRDESHL